MSVVLPWRLPATLCVVFTWVACTPPAPVAVPVEPLATPPPTPPPAGTTALTTDGYTACTLDLAGEAHCRVHPVGGPPPPLDWTPVVDGPPGPLTEVYPFGPCGLQDGSVVCAEALYQEGRDTLEDHANRLATAYVGYNQSGPFGVGIDEQTGALSTWGDVPDFMPEHAEGPFSAVDVGVQTLCALAADGVTCWSDLPGPAENAPMGSFTELVTGWGHACALSDQGHVLCWGEEPAEAVEPSLLGGRVQGIGSGYALVGAEVVSLGDGYRFEPWGQPSYGLFASKSGLVCVTLEDEVEPYCMFDPRIPPAG